MSKTRASDVDALHWQAQEAEHLQRNGWQVTPPEQWTRRNPLCRNLSCLTRVPPNRSWCRFCAKTRKLRLERERQQRIRVAA